MVVISFTGCAYHTMSWHEKETDLRKAEQANGDTTQHGWHWVRERALEKKEIATRHCRVVAEKGFDIVYVNDTRHMAIFNVQKLGSWSRFSLGPTLLKGTFMRAHLPEGDYYFSVTTGNNTSNTVLKHVGSESKFCGYTGTYVHQDFIADQIGGANDNLTEVISNDSLAE